LKIGPFILLQGCLVVDGICHPEAWEEAAERMFELQRYIPWYIGDMINFGEAQWGDDVYQALPIDISEEMATRLSGVAKKYPPNERFASLSWTHHNLALREKDPVLRRGLLKRAVEDSMTTKEFGKYVTEFTRGTRDA
jgi:hypothetical protein